MVYRWCIVPMCKNTTTKNPHKNFINVPKDEKTRKLWIISVRRDPKEFSSTSVLYVCEDHFNLQEDMENYMKWKLIGEKKRIKKNVVPHKFDCQLDQKPTSVQLPKNPISKKMRLQLVEESRASTSTTNSQTGILDEIILTPEITSYRSIGIQVNIKPSTYTNKSIQCVLKTSSPCESCSLSKRKKRHTGLSSMFSRTKKIYFNPFYVKQAK